MLQLQRAVSSRWGFPPPSPNFGTSGVMLALSAQAYGSYGGIAQSTRDMIAALGTHRSINAVHVLPRFSQGVVDAPSDIVQYDPIAAPFDYALGAMNLALRIRPRLIYCGHLFMAPLAASVAKLAGSQLLCHLHGIEIWKRPSLLRCLGLTASDLVFCVSNDTRRRLCEFAPTLECRSAVVFNTVDPRFTPGDRRSARAAFGLSQEVVLLTVSRLDARQRHKGHEKVIGMLPSLLAQGTPARYLIAGEGDDRPRLEQLAGEMGVAEHVTFLGQVSMQELPNLYRAADLYVMPSTGEGFGIAFIEAMACGTQAIGLAVGGAPDALCHGELGLAVSAEDFSKALIAALAKPRPDPEQLAQSVYERFGRDSFRRRVITAIETMIR